MLLRLDNTKVLFYFLCITGTVLVHKSSWNLSLNLSSPEESSACACHKCLIDGDPRFKGLVRASPAPFLSRKITTSEKVFNWWKGMQFDRRAYSVYNQTVDKLFKMFPPGPDVVEPSSERCRTCAVVGNSGNLKGSHYGPLIDFHDIVIRMNHAPLKGYEADVGTKTTHHVMYPMSAVNLDNTTHLVFFPFKIKDLEWLIKTFNLGKNSAVNSKTIANKNLVMVLNPAFMKYVHEMWLGKKGKYPSTGFLTLVLSLQMCDVVSVFGFGADEDGNWSHYFEILRDKKLKTGQHAGAHEYILIQQLHEQQKIHFFKGF